MFTSGDVLFPEIFEITLGSEKGKYLLPEDICLSKASQKFNLFTDRQRRGRGFAPVFRRLRNRVRHRLGGFIARAPNRGLTIQFIWFFLTHAPDIGCHFRSSRIQSRGGTTCVSSLRTYPAGQPIAGDRNRAPNLCIRWSNPGTSGGDLSGCEPCSMMRPQVGERS